jgi:L-ascorbate metabolism protein UlaG (beta-lactamase superfamily)
MEEAFAVRLTYYAHSSFLLEAADGTRVIIDAYRTGCFGNSFRYDPIDETADVVVATHTHDDHGATDTIPGHPQVFIHPASATVGPWTITGIDVAHDGEDGRSRGKNTMIVLDDGDLRVAHLGDLGHTLTAETVAALGAIDVLLIPVGGFFTIDHLQAAEVADAIGPRVIVPMHFKTPKVDFPISDAEGFLSTQANVERLTGSTVEITRASLPADRVTWVFKPAR